MRPSAGDLLYYEALAQIIPLMIGALLIEYGTIDTHRDDTGPFLPALARMSALFGLASAEWSVLRTLYLGRSQLEFRMVVDWGLVAGFLMVVYLPTLMLVRSIDVASAAKSSVMSQCLNAVRYVFEGAVVIGGAAAAKAAIELQYDDGVSWWPWMAGGLAVAVGLGIVAVSHEGGEQRRDVAAYSVGQGIEVDPEGAPG